MALTPAELEGLIAFQVGALAGIASLETARVTHVKPHGALNNLACIDRGVADTLCRAIRAIDRNLILLAPAASQLLDAGRAAGLPVVEEIFADRAYLPDGQLVPRARPDAMIHGAEACLEMCIRDSRLMTVARRILRIFNFRDFRKRGAQVPPSKPPFISSLSAVSRTGFCFHGRQVSLLAAPSASPSSKATSRSP